MSILDKHIAFVNEQIEFHKKSADRFKNNKFRANKHLETAVQFESLLRDIRQADTKLEEKSEISASSIRPKQLRLSLTPDELEGLPEELLNELSSGDRSEFLIINILEDSGGIASLDRILVELYKRTHEITKRSTLTSRIYRMIQRNLIYTVPGKKGVYSTRPMNQEEVDKQFGEEMPDLFDDDISDIL